MAAPKVTLTVNVMPPSSIHGDDVSAADKAPSRFALAVEITYTFSVVWRKIEERYKSLYGEAKATKYSFSKIQDMTKSDIGLSDSVSDVFPIGTPRDERELFVLQEVRGTEGSIPLDSELRPKRTAEDMSPEEQENVKRRKMEEDGNSNVDNPAARRESNGPHAQNGAAGDGRGDGEESAHEVTEDGPFKVPAIPQNTPARRRRRNRSGAPQETILVQDSQAPNSTQRPSWLNASRRQPPSSSPPRSSPIEAAAVRANTTAPAAAPTSRTARSARAAQTPGDEAAPKPTLPTPESALHRTSSEEAPTSAQQPPSTNAPTPARSGRFLHPPAPRNEAEVDMAVHDPIDDEDFLPDGTEDQQDVDVNARNDSNNRQQPSSQPLVPESTPNPPATNAFDSLTSSQAARRSVSRIPELHRPWTIEEDRAMLRAMSGNVNVFGVSNTDLGHRSDSAIRNRRRWLRELYPGGVVPPDDPLYEAPQPSSTPSTTAPSATTQNTSKWSDKEVRLLRKAIVDGLDPIEIRTQYFQTRSDSAVRKKFRQHESKLLEAEKVRPDFPQAAFEHGWTARHSLKLRRTVRENVDENQAYQLWFGTLSKVLFQRKLKGYKQQLQDQHLTLSQIDGAMDQQLEFQEPAQPAHQDSAPPADQPSSAPTQAAVASSPLVLNSNAQSEDVEPASEQEPAPVPDEVQAPEPRRQTNGGTRRLVQGTQLRRNAGTGGQTTLNFQRAKRKNAIRPERPSDSQLDRQYGPRTGAATTTTSVQQNPTAQQEAIEISSEEEESSDDDDEEDDEGLNDDDLLAQEAEDEDQVQEHATAEEQDEEAEDEDEDDLRGDASFRVWGPPEDWPEEEEDEEAEEDDDLRRDATFRVEGSAEDPSPGEQPTQEFEQDQDKQPAQDLQRVPSTDSDETYGSSDARNLTTQETDLPDADDAQEAIDGPQCAVFSHVAIPTSPREIGFDEEMEDEEADVDESEEEDGVAGLIHTEAVEAEASEAEESDDESQAFQTQDPATSRSQRAAQAAQSHIDHERGEREAARADRLAVDSPNESESEDESDDESEPDQAPVSQAPRTHRLVCNDPGAQEFLDMQAAKMAARDNENQARQAPVAQAAPTHSNLRSNDPEVQEFLDMQAQTMADRANTSNSRPGALRPVENGPGARRRQRDAEAYHRIPVSTTPRVLGPSAPRGRSSCQSQTRSRSQIQGSADSTTQSELQSQITRQRAQNQIAADALHYDEPPYQVYFFDIPQPDFDGRIELGRPGFTTKVLPTDDALKGDKHWRNKAINEYHKTEDVEWAKIHALQGIIKLDHYHRNKALKQFAKNEYILAMAETMKLDALRWIALSASDHKVVASLAARIELLRRRQQIRNGEREEYRWRSAVEIVDEDDRSKDVELEVYDDLLERSSERMWDGYEDLQASDDALGASGSEEDNDEYKDVPLVDNWTEMVYEIALIERKWEEDVEALVVDEEAEMQDRSPAPIAHNNQEESSEAEDSEDESESEDGEDDFKTAEEPGVEQLVERLEAEADGLNQNEGNSGSEDDDDDEDTSSSEESDDEDLGLPTAPPLDSSNAMSAPSDEALQNLQQSGEAEVFHDSNDGTQTNCVRHSSPTVCIPALDGLADEDESDDVAVPAAAEEIDSDDIPLFKKRKLAATEATAPAPATAATESQRSRRRRDRRSTHHQPTPDQQLLDEMADAQQPPAPLQRQNSTSRQRRRAKRHSQEGRLSRQNSRSDLASSFSSAGQEEQIPAPIQTPATRRLPPRASQIVQSIERPQNGTAANTSSRVRPSSRVTPIGETQQSEEPTPPDHVRFQGGFVRLRFPSPPQRRVEVRRTRADVQAEYERVFGNGDDESEESSSESESD